MPDEHLADETLSRLVDDDLPAEDRLAAERHLASCAVCREQLDALRATVLLLHRMPMARPARSLQLGPAYERRPAGWRRLSGRLLPALPALRAGALAVVLLVGGITAVGVLRDEPESSLTVLEATVQPDDPRTATAQPDPAQSRSGPPVDAAGLPTSTAAAMSTVPPTAPPTEADAPVPAPSEGLDAASSASGLPATEMPEAGSFFGTETNEEGDSMSAAGDAVDGELARDDVAAESSAEEPGDLAQESESSSSSVVAKETPSPAAGSRPRSEVATSVGSPAASPVSSPVASPVASPISRVAGGISLEGDTGPDGPSSMVIGGMGWLALLATTVGLAWVGNALRRISSVRMEPSRGGRR